MTQNVSRIVARGRYTLSCACGLLRVDNLITTEGLATYTGRRFDAVDLLAFLAPVTPSAAWTAAEALDVAHVRVTGSLVDVPSPDIGWRAAYTIDVPSGGLVVHGLAALLVRDVTGAQLVSLLSAAALPSPQSLSAGPQTLQYDFLLARAP